MSDDGPYTFTGLLPEILTHHILPRLGFYDRWQLLQTAKRYARVIPTPWTYHNKTERYLSSAPLDVAHEYIAHIWFGHELNRQPFYQHQIIKAFVRNTYHAHVDTILVPYAKRYIGSCVGDKTDEVSNLRLLFVYLLRYKSPARFLHEWAERFPTEWNLLLNDGFRLAYDRGPVVFECLRRPDVLGIFLPQKSPLPLSFTTALWSWMPLYLSPPLSFWIFERDSKASKGFLALVMRDTNFRAMLEEKLIRTPEFPDQAIEFGSSSSWAFPALVTLCEQFKVPVTPMMMAHEEKGYADVDWLAPLIRVLGTAWVRTHTDIGAAVRWIREHDAKSLAYVQLLVDHELLDMTRDEAWSLEKLCECSLETLHAMVTKLLPQLGPHRDKIPGCERVERIVQWLYKEKEVEKAMWPHRK
jgi:hypothetical protein